MATETRFNGDFGWIQRIGRSHRTLLIAGCTLLLVAAPASANGAMSLALGTFGWDMWGAYVVAIVLFEALVMGRFLRVPVAKALTASVGANFLTAVVGGVVSGFLSYGFLGMFGSRLNPNPMGQTVVLFTLFAVVSAPAEAWVWLRATSGSRKTFGARHVSRLSLVVHLLGVPLGLAILLSPGRPYRGLEMQVHAQREVWLLHHVRKALNDYVALHQALPPDRTYAEILQRLRPQLGPYASDPGLWAAAYRPNYYRFDLGEMRRVPIEWNPGLGKEGLFEGPPRTVWLSRSCSDGGYCQGLIVDLPGRVVGRTTDPVKLGLKGSGSEADSGARR